MVSLASLTAFIRRRQPPSLARAKGTRYLIAASCATGPNAAVSGGARVTAAENESWAAGALSSP